MSTLARTHSIRLSDGHRAEFCQALGRALKAGLPPERALEGAKDICNGAIRRELHLASNGVRKGTGLVSALDRQGLLSELDYAMLSCAEEVGALDAVLLNLAERYEARHNRWSRIKSKLVYPAFLLVFAIFIGPVPALFAGRITGSDYALRTISALALLAIVIHLVQILLRLYNARGWPRILSRLARSLPVVRKLARLHERADVCGNLAIMFKAGMPIRDALDAYRQAEPEGLRREHLLQAKESLDGGASVADALGEAELLDPHEGYAIVSTGEGAGKLEESLLRCSLSCQSRLDGEYDLLTRAVPLLVFFLVAWVIVSGLLG
jgi:type II secretory pathway component PulF